MTSRRLLAAAAATALLLASSISGAAGQAGTGGPPPSGPAPGEPGAGPPPDATEEADQAATDAAAALAVEIVILAHFDAFEEPWPDALVELADRLEPDDPFFDEDDLLDVLATAERDDAEYALGVMLAEGVHLDDGVATVLVAHTDDELEALADGVAEPEDADVYLTALDDLLFRGGRPRLNGEIDPVGLAVTAVALVDDWIDGTDEPSAAPTTTADGATPTTAPATTTVGPAGAAPPPPRRDGPSPWLLVAALAVLAAAVVAVVAVRRRGAGTSARLDDLLEVSRRLAAAVTPADVARIAVGESVRAASATAGALVLVEEADLRVGYQDHEGLLVGERLADGVLARVAETGQHVAMVSQTEPSIRNLPVSLLALPVIGSGRVVAVILLVRGDDRTFGTDEVDALRPIGPVVAAALSSAAHADAAVGQALVDPLTGVGNRRRLEQDLDQLLAGDGSAAVVMVDLDHFKVVNDQHGHPVGDALLRSVAEVLQQGVRPGDEVYRYGGEEFCVLLPSADRTAAADVAERLRSAVAAEASTTTEAGDLVAVTTSIGVAAGLSPVTAQLLLARADAALYDAKRAGRDRVVVAED